MGYPVARSAPGRAASRAGLSNARGAVGAASMANARTAVAPLTAAETAGLAARGARFLPLLGILALGYDIYRLWGAKGQMGMVCGVPFGRMSGGVLSCGATVTNATAMQAVNWTAPTLTLKWTVPSANPSFKTVVGAFSAANPFLGTSPRPKVANVELPEYVPATAPDWSPMTNPWELPVSQPAPDYKPLPWSIPPYRTNPWPNPDPSPIPSPRRDPVPRQVPREVPYINPLLPRPDVWPTPVRPIGDPVINPGPETDPGPGPRPQPRTNPRRNPNQNNPRRNPRRNRNKDKTKKPKVEVNNKPRANRPPPRNTKEMKMRTKAAGLAFAITNLITEARDAIDSLWKALPKKFRSEQTSHGVGKFRSTNAPTIQQKLQDIYNASDKMTLDEQQKFYNDAIDNLITDQFKDYVFGKVGSAQSGVNQGMGRPVGVGAGPAL